MVNAPASKAGGSNPLQVRILSPPQRKSVFAKRITFNVAVMYYVYVLRSLKNEKILILGRQKKVLFGRWISIVLWDLKRWLRGIMDLPWIYLNRFGGRS